MKQLTRLTYCLVFSMFPVVLFAQNLIPNPGFEGYNSCPTGPGGPTYEPIAYSPGFLNFPTTLSWVSALKITTPDYFSTCATLASGVQVPETNFGHQAAHGGDAYTGILAWDATLSSPTTILSEWREYLQTRLSQPLQAGSKYCVSFYVNAAVSQKAGFNIYNYVALDELGVNFSSTQQLSTTATTLNLSYSMVNPKGRFINDTTNWTKVKGIYTATGGEEWMTLGYFGTGVPAYQTILADPSNRYRAYYFIDDVSVEQIIGADTFITFHDSVVCSPANVNITLSNTLTSDVKYWSNGDTGVNDISVQDTGKYWCLSEVDCFTYIDTFYVRYEDGHSLDLGKDTFNCNLQPITISANRDYSNYSWSNGATTKSITVTTPGDYILTVHTPCGILKDTVNVDIQSVPPPPVVTDTMICQYTENALIRVDGKKIRWYTALSNQVGHLNQPAIVAAKPAYYTYYVTQSYGRCESEKVPLNIEVKYKPIDRPEEMIKICEGEEISIGQDVADINYRWNTGEFICCIKPRQNGIYYVDMHNICGTGRVTYDVHFSECNNCITVPTAFSPNRDGINDELAVFVECPVTGYHLRIYNRWGGQVFDSQNTLERWDGTHDGQLLDQGIYVYTIEYNSYTTGKSRFLKGNITLLR